MSMRKKGQDKYRIRECENGRYALQERVNWDVWRVISTHRDEMLAYKNMRQAIHREMRA